MNYLDMIDVVLCRGKSSRMGADKGLLTNGNQTNLVSACLP